MMVKGYNYTKSHIYGSMSSAELKRKLSKAQNEHMTTKRDVVAKRVGTIGIIFLGLIIAVTVDSRFGALISLSGILSLFFFLDVSKPQEVESRIRELERELTRNKRLESAKIQSIDRASTLLQEGGLANLQEVLNIYSKYGKKVSVLKKEIAQEKEKLLDYDGAIAEFEKLGLNDDAKRVRRKMLDEKKVDQTVIQGDYVDDRDTIIKDSVISKSNIGSGNDDKLTKIKELKELHDAGAIDDDEFKQIKKEILRK